MISLNEAFKKIEIFKNISPKTIEYIKPFSNLKKYREKDHIFMDKDEVSNIYIIVYGKAALYKLSNFGDKKVIIMIV